MRNWLPDMDLNHDKQIQSLLCYRYTIGQGNIVKLEHLKTESRICAWPWPRGWLIKGRMNQGKPPLPCPLLHKFLEERENTPELSLHEPAVLRLPIRNPQPAIHN